MKAEKHIAKSKTVWIGTVLAVLQTIELQSGAISQLFGSDVQAAIGIITAIAMVVLRPITSGTVYVK